MFRCEVTGKLSKVGEKCNKIVVQTRPMVYYKWEFSEERNVWEKVESGRGFEIVHEINATEAGLKQWEQMRAQEDLKAGAL